MQAEEALQVLCTHTHTHAHTHTHITRGCCVIGWASLSQSVREELDGLFSERDGLQSSLATATEELSTLRSELSTAQSDLATFQTQVGSAQRGLETAEKEAWSLREELGREKESHSATKQKLTSAMKVSETSTYTLYSSPMHPSQHTHLPPYTLSQPTLITHAPLTTHTHISPLYTPSQPTLITHAPLTTTHISPTLHPLTTHTHHPCIPHPGGQGKQCDEP